MMTIEEIKSRAQSERDRIDNERAAKIAAHNRPVYLYYIGAYTIEIATAPDADNLHKWQAVHFNGTIDYQGRADLLSLAVMLRTGNIELQVKKEESNRRTADYLAECSRKVSDICDAAKNLLTAYKDGFITANELKNGISEITA